MLILRVTTSYVYVIELLSVVIEVTGVPGAVRVVTRILVLFLSFL